MADFTSALQGEIPRVAITGANGFVGSALCRHLEDLGIPYLAIVRKGKSLPFEQKAGKTIEIETFTEVDVLGELLAGCNCVIHLAARVHQMGVQVEELYIQDNVEMTSRMIDALYRANGNHFVLLSSIKVYGETQLQPYTVDTPCRPVSPYGKSKLLAEQKAIELCLSHKMALDMVRIPIVFDSTAKGNIALLRKLIHSRFPLPFKAFQKRRSQVHLSQLVAQLAQIVLAQRGSSERKCQLHLIADLPPVSTQELVGRLSQEMSIRTIQFWIPLWMLWILGYVCDALTKLFKVRLPFGREALRKLSEEMIVIPGRKIIS